MFQRKVAKKAVGCLMALTMVMTNSYMGINVGGRVENVAYAEDELTYTVGNSTYSYKVIEDGSIEITNYRGSDAEIVIPAEIDGKSVTSIGDCAFWFNDNLISVEIPDSVMRIGTAAFERCRSLMSVNIPIGVTDIGSSAFEGCSSLTSVEIPSSVTDISSSTFAGCSSLTNIEIPNSVTGIGARTFYSCSNLTKVEIPNSVTSIDDYAFYGCSSLTNVEIPDSVTVVGFGVFARCSSLEMINVDKENDNYKSQNGILFTGDMSEIIQYPAGKSDGIYIIPNSVTSIEGGAFGGCCSLTSVEIPSSVTDIGSSAFAGCSSLTNVEIPDGITYIGIDAFYGCSSLTSVEIPTSVTDIGYDAFGKCSSLEQIAVNEENKNYKSQDGVLFNVDMSILIQYPEGKKEKSYIIPNSVTNIGIKAFNGCSSLTSVEIPNSVTNITYTNLPVGVILTGSYNTFEGCSSLEMINVDEENKNFKSQGGVLFNVDMTVLIKYPEGKKEKSYIIPNSVTDIGYDTFDKCSSLEQINVDEENKNYKSQDGVLFNVDMSKLIRYPEGKKEKSYTIPNSVTDIFGATFRGCSSLISIEIPTGVAYISYDAFEDCENLTIYGEKTSYVEQYANKHNIPFVALKTLSDDITNIYVKFIEDTMSEDISLKAKQLSESDKGYTDINFKGKITDSDVKPEDVIFTAYDISLVDENNSPVQPNGTVTVKIPCPANYNGENCKVYRVGEAGEFTDMNAEYQNGFMVFETDHFSTYVITETELITGVQVITGDANGDGNMDIKDSAIIKRYLAGWDVEIDMTAADMDGDGKVTIKDSALIKRQLAGWE